MMRDYVRKLEELVDEHDEIEGKLGKYQMMRFDDIYKPLGAIEAHHVPFAYS
jgi:hypothetical protein